MSDARDDGFTLVEALVAMLLFSVLAISTAGVLLNTFGLNTSNAARVTAANLASEEVSRVRQLRAVDVPDGSTTVTPKPVVNGVEYTVTRTANLVEADASTSPCTGPATSSSVKLAYKLVTVSVTWPKMGSVKPVRQDTLLSLGVGFGGVGTTTGTGAVAITGADGLPRSGVTVTLTPSGTTRTTGDDGCAVFTGLDPTVTYTAAVDQTGWVDRSGVRRALTAAFTVAAGGISRHRLTYDRAGVLAMTLESPEGLMPPAGLGVTLTSPNFPSLDELFNECPPGVRHLCVSGTVRTAERLFPGRYGAWAGTCQDARPVSAVTSTVMAGQTTSVGLKLAGVKVHVVNPGGVLTTGYTAYAIRQEDGVCLTHSWAMTPANASVQSLALPQGTWLFALNPTGAETTVTWPTRKLVIGEPVPTVNVRIP